MTMTESAKLIEGELKPLGFSRRKYTWNREISKIKDVIAIEKSKDEHAITATFALFDPEVYGICWNEQIPEFVQAADCTVRARIGQLIDGRDYWWNLSNQAEISDLVRRVADLAPRFFSQMRQPQKLLEWLSGPGSFGGSYPPPLIHRAILKSRLGDKQEACVLLSALASKTSEPWRERIARTRRTLGCDLAGERRSGEENGVTS